MEQKVTSNIGTCIWFKNTYGYLGYGVYMNGVYDGQVYAHYKNINRKGLRNPKYREIQSGDVCSFSFGEGYFCKGTQAKNIKIIKYGENKDTSGTAETDA